MLDLSPLTVEYWLRIDKDGGFGELKNQGRLDTMPKPYINGRQEGVIIGTGWSRGFRQNIGRENWIDGLPGYWIGTHISGSSKCMWAPLFLADANSTTFFGTWTHVALTYNNSHIQGYVNGTQLIIDRDCRDTPTGIYRIPYAFHDWFIGGNVDDTAGPYTGDPLPGAMDEVRVWSIPLTQQDIVSRMHRTLTSAERSNVSLAFYFSFDGYNSSSAQFVDQTSRALFNAR